MEPSCSQKINDFQYGVRPPSWIWEFLNFLVTFPRLGWNMWPHTKFREIWTSCGWDVEIWFSKWRPSAMLDFRNWTFSSRNLRVCAIMPPHSKFCLNRTIWSRVVAKKWFSIWRSSAILNLGISEFLSCFRRLTQNLCLRTRFRQIRTIRGWDMEL